MLRTTIVLSLFVHIFLLPLRPAHAEGRAGDELSVQLDGNRLRIDPPPTPGVSGPPTLAVAPEGALRWRALGQHGWGPWHELRGWMSREVELPAGWRAFELRARRQSESGRLQWVRVGVPPPERTRLPRRAQSNSGPPRRILRAAQDSVRCAGRLVLRDRIFDAQGYTGQSRALPLRHTVVELRRVADDSLLVRSASDERGRFELLAALSAPTELALWIRSEVGGVAGLQLQVLATSATHELELASLGLVAPGSEFSLPDLVLPDPGGAAVAQAFHVLDLCLSAAQMLAAPEVLGRWPGDGVVPPVRWNPDGNRTQTRYEAGLIQVAEPGGGDSDAWSDGLVLAALGQWVLRAESRLELDGSPELRDRAVDPREAHGRGAALAFAASVRTWRATHLVDLEGAPADHDVAVIADLPTAPPLGFSAGAEAAVDLEQRTMLDGSSIGRRGQLGALNVSCMYWDLVDHPSSPDAAAGDDDPIAGDAASWLRILLQDLPNLPIAEPLSFEDVHDLWIAAHGQETELSQIAVEIGACALFDDPAESDDLPADAVELVASLPPEFSEPGPRVVINELGLGERDAVELFNGGNEAQDIGGWRIETRRNGFGSGAQRETTVPASTLLLPGQSLVLHEGGGSQYNGSRDLYDPAWSIPWQPEDDGACILVDDSGAAIDFVRWDGADPSLTPVPAGTAFSGRIHAPPWGQALGRGPAGGDTDAASDFSPQAPSLRLPNLPPASLRTLRPREDVDHLRLVAPASGILEFHTLRLFDDARPRWSLLDSHGAVVGAADALNPVERASVLELSVEAGERLLVRLEQGAEALSSGGQELVAYLRTSRRHLLAVADLRARVLPVGPRFETVQLGWSNRGDYDSLRVAVDEAVIQVLPGFIEQTELDVGLGHHLITVRPVLLGVGGELATARVFGGPTSCGVDVGFEVGEPERFSGQGFHPTNIARSGFLSIYDRFAMDPDLVTAEASLELQDPVDLTGQSRLIFWHAAHLSPGLDLALVELSLDDGDSWTELARYDGAAHDGTGDDDPANWLDAQMEESDWVREEIDLSAFAGDRARFRLRRRSDPNSTAIGWWIDDLFFGNLEGSTWWLSPAGSDAHGCGPRERPLRTFAPLLGRIAAGDSLRLTAGSFSDLLDPVSAGTTLPTVLPLPSGIIVRGAGVERSRLEPPAGARGIHVAAGPGLRTTLSDLSIVGGESGVMAESTELRIERLMVLDARKALSVEGGSLELVETVVGGGDLGVELRSGAAALERCTFADVSTAVWLRAGTDTFSLRQSIIVTSGGPCLIAEIPPASQIDCNLFFGALEPFVNLPSPLGPANAWADPLFCEPEARDYTVASGSPAFSLGCGALGAFEAGCAGPVDSPSLGSTRSRLRAPWPNPFNPRTVIEYEVAVAGPVRLDVFDARGRRVRTLVTLDDFEGRGRVIWTGTDQTGRPVASGVYWLRLEAGDVVDSRAVVLLR